MGHDDRTRAYLYDLYVAPTWRDRFDQLFIDCVGIPSKGRMLMLECGTGGLALEIASQIGDAGSVVATDSDAENLELAHAKVLTTRLENIRFVSSAGISNELTPNTYAAALGDASLLPASRIEPMLRDLLRTITVEGRVVVYTITRGSFDEFFSVFWEALYECGLAEQLQPDLEVLLQSHPTTQEVQEWASLAGLRNIEIFSESEEFSFPSGEEFLSSPVIAGYWLKTWLDIVPTAAEAERVREAIAIIIDRDRGDLTFEISIKAALVTGDRRREGSPRRVAPIRKAVVKEDDEWSEN